MPRILCFLVLCVLILAVPMTASAAQAGRTTVTSHGSGVTAFWWAMLEQVWHNATTFSPFWQPARGAGAQQTGSRVRHSTVTTRSTPPLTGGAHLVDNNCDGGSMLDPNGHCGG